MLSVDFRSWLLAAINFVNYIQKTTNFAKTAKDKADGKFPPA
jgi:hypothetical protein